MDESLIERFARDPGSLDPETRDAVRRAVDTSKEAYAVFSFWSEYERILADTPVSPESFDAAADLADRIAARWRVVPLEPWDGSLRRRAPVAMAARTAPAGVRFRPVGVLATPDREFVVRLMYDSVAHRLEAFLLGPEAIPEGAALLLGTGPARLPFDASGRASLECESETTAASWTRQAGLELG